MTQEIVIPAQVRAGRALIGWSQEQLAQEADVGLSTVRDFESEKRAADTSAVNDLRRALLNGGVVFTHGSPEGGPGVRLVADRPNVIRAPTTLQMFEGMPFGVEWQGKTTTVFVTYSVLEDLGGFTRKLSEKMPSIPLTVIAVSSSMPPRLPSIVRRILIAATGSSSSRSISTR